MKGAFTIRRNIGGTIEIQVKDTITGNIVFAAFISPEEFTAGLLGTEGARCRYVTVNDDEVAV